MKAFKFPLLLLAASSVTSMATVVTFDGYTAETPLTSYPGWSATESITTGKLIGWVEPVDGEMAGAIGGAYSEAANANFGVTYDSSYYGPTINFSVDLLFAGSTFEAPGRDSFGIKIEAGSNSSLSSVMTMVFFPTVDTGDGIARWEVGYSVGGGEVIYTQKTIREEPWYAFDFSVTGSAYTFSFGSEVFTGNIAGYNAANDGMGDISFTWTKAPTTPHGTNYMVFDNITVVPEPSVALLSGLATLVMLRRRR